MTRIIGSTPSIEKKPRIFLGIARKNPRIRENMEVFLSIGLGNVAGIQGIGFPAEFFKIYLNRIIARLE